MRQPKIRGSNRRLKNIEKWIEQTSAADLSFLREGGADYTRIGVLPWINSDNKPGISEPYGKVKKALVAGLFKIYEEWKKKISQLDQPFYLKIWLNEPRFAQSQVVCATGKEIARYENLFEDSDETTLPLADEKLQDAFKWEVKNDNDLYWERELTYPVEEYESEQDYREATKLHSRLKNNKIKNTKAVYSGEPAFLVKRGYIFVGGN